MTETKPRRVVKFRSASEDERAGWVRLNEFTKQYPKYLPFVEKTNPTLYERLLAGFQSLAIDARSETWRDEREGFGARPEQLIPGTPGSFSDRTDWLVWLLMGGRGSGKSRTGAEAIRELLFGRKWQTNPRVALVGQTLESVRIDMITNTLLEVLPPGCVIQWKRSTCELTIDLGWVTVNGRRQHRTAYLKGYSSEAARKLRGPNFHLAWCDEIATWSDAKHSPGAPDTTWSNMKMAVRLDDKPRNAPGRGTWIPRIIATTTPKSVALIRNPDEHDVLNPGKGIHDDEHTVISNMTTLDNEANLSSHFRTTVIDPLKGTRLYDQEVLGILMDEALGAQWSDELIKQMGRPPNWLKDQAGGLKRVVIGVDPSIGAGLGDECGIVVAGIAHDDRVYILEDLSIRAKASEWCRVIEAAYNRWNAACVVVEVNQGGELVEETMGRYAPNLPVVSIWAKVGKLVRAEPVALLSDSDKVRFSGGIDPENNPFERLHHQMKSWEGDGPSPDRLDAFVYAVIYLLPTSAGASDLVTIIRSGTRHRRDLLGSSR